MDTYNNVTLTNGTGLTNGNASYSPKEMADYVMKRTQCRPSLGIVCGSGLGKLVDYLTDKECIPYSTIPGFPISTVAGHSGNLVFGKISGKLVVLMQGRCHLYEGYSVQTCTAPIRMLGFLGVKTIFLTNASGGLNKSYEVGDIMIMKDHINFPGLAGQHPLTGPNDETIGPRFLPMNDAYDKQLRQLAYDVAVELGHKKIIHEGVYFMQSGPSYETPTEAFMIQQMGGDVTGMSTVHEVIVARHMSMRVFALSLITNKVVLEHDSLERANHLEVVEVGLKRSVAMAAIVEKMVERLTDL